MSIVEFEAANITAPLQNSAAMKNIVSIYATPNAAYTDLSKLFGQMHSGHYYTLQADGSKVYFAMSSVPTGAVSTTVGTGLNQAWPLPDGVEKSFRIPNGREVATGVATQMVYKYLQYKAVATCTLWIYRSSVGPTQGVEQFPAP